MLRPFDYSGILRGADQIARYQGLPGSLVAMLRAAGLDSVVTWRPPCPAGLTLSWLIRVTRWIWCTIVPLINH